MFNCASLGCMVRYAMQGCVRDGWVVVRLQRRATVADLLAAPQKKTERVHHMEPRHIQKNMVISGSLWRRAGRHGGVSGSNRRAPPTIQEYSAMGLKPGPHGVKAFMRNTLPEAFAECDSFEEVVSAFGCGRGASVGVVDGNIMMMAVPTSVRTFDAYVSLVYRQIRRVSASFGMIVLCFDEPESVPAAKIEEQRARDASRASGSKRTLDSADGMLGHDLQGDTYTLEQLRSVQDCHSVMFDRSTRPRFVDEVLRSALERLAYAADQLCILVDGLDLSGCSRGIGCTREPSCHRFGGVGYQPDSHVVATQTLAADVCASILKREHRIGEADIKLADVHRRLLSICRQRSATEGYQIPMHLVVHVTTDLDQLPIDMLTEVADTYALRSVITPATSQCVLADVDWRPATALMMKNQAGRGKSPAQKGSDTKAYTLIDVRGITRQITELTPSRHPCEALASFCASFALGGCDFVPKNIPALRATELIQSTRSLLQDNTSGCGNGPPIDMRLFQSEDACHAMLPSARCICLRASEDVRCHRQGRTAQTHGDILRDVHDTVLKRALWTVRYWSLNGHPSEDVRQWGFGAGSD